MTSAHRPMSDYLSPATGAAACSLCVLPPAEFIRGDWLTSLSKDPTECADLQWKRLRNHRHAWPSGAPTRLYALQMDATPAHAAMT